MTNETTNKAITDYANYLLGLANTPDGLTGISEEDLTRLGTNLKSQHESTISTLERYRKSYEAKLTQEAVAPVKSAVEAFINSPKRPRILSHQDSEEHPWSTREVTQLKHNVYIPMDMRNGATFKKVEADLRQQYKGFPEGSVSLGQYFDENTGYIVYATIDLSKAGVKEAAEAALAALDAPKSAIDPTVVRADTGQRLR